jgi:hypothetical protein
MENKSNLAKGLHSLLILKAKAKGTSYLEELRLLKSHLEERAENKKIIDTDKSGDKVILKVKTENELIQQENGQTKKTKQKQSLAAGAILLLKAKKHLEKMKELQHKKPKHI